MTGPRVPHLRIVLLFCGIAVGVYIGFSIWVVLESGDAAMIGDVIGTWKSLAVAAFTFWVGASSGGKARNDGPTGKHDDPVAVEPV